MKPACSCTRTALPLCRPRRGAEWSCYVCLALAGDPVITGNPIADPATMRPLDGWRVVGSDERMRWPDVVAKLDAGLSPALVRAPHES